MSDRSDTPWESLMAYLAGEGSPAEWASVERWIAEDPEHGITVAQLRMALGMVRPAALPPLDIAALQAAVSQQIRRPSISVGRTSRERDRRIMRRAIPFALAVCACLGFGILFLGRGRMSDVGPARVYSTTEGQRATVVLANGAHVLLGPATRISVVQASVGIVATVDGEALFTVPNSHATPFSVRAGNALIRVLGTTFSVRHYATDPDSRVAVMEGRVSLAEAGDAQSRSSHRPPVVLIARALGAVDDSGHVHVMPNSAIEDYTAWTNGTLVFRQTPIAEIVAELSRAYGADIRLADSTLSRRAFTWNVSVTHVPLAEALDALTTALDAHVTRSGSIITIVPGTSVSRDSMRQPFPRSEKQYGR